MKNNTLKKYALFYILIGFLGGWSPFAYAEDEEEEWREAAPGL